MKKRWMGVCAALLMVLSVAGFSNAAIIDFTGGDAFFTNGSSVSTSGAGTYWDVDYYVEDGFKLDFIGDTGIVGEYYGGGNDVIHGHWLTGGISNLTEIKVSKLDGATFDLNYFILTSNTDTGGGGASGNEETWINSSNGFSQLLPPDDWGWSGPNPQIWLDSNFDNISWFSFTVSNEVDCFGMDNFYIDEPAPPNPNVVPEPGTVFLTGLGLIGLLGLRMRRRNKI